MKHWQSAVKKTEGESEAYPLIMIKNFGVTAEVYLHSFNLIEISTLDVELRCIPLLRLSSLNKIQILDVRVEVYPLSFNLVEI